MPFNTFGSILSVTTWGESHGPAIGCVVDGLPARIPLAESDIQPALDRRRPGKSATVSPRQELDQVEILSGVYQGMTTGHPVSLVIKNTNQRSKDYSALAGLFRPGHADAAYEAKFAIRDPRGGGRSSARETACRVAAGAVAAKMLGSLPGTASISVKAGLISLGGIDADTGRWDDDAIDQNDLFCPDPSAVPAMHAALASAREAGDSLGGIVEARITGLPAGLGEPLYDRLDARIGGMLMGLNAVKGVEIGDGFAAARQRGSVHNDAMREAAGGRLGDTFATNHSGGVLGGISTGATVVVRAAFKPTPSVASVQETVDVLLKNTKVSIEGRHDPAVCIRAAPVVEAMLWLIVGDFVLLKRAREG